MRDHPVAIFGSLAAMAALVLWMRCDPTPEAAKVGDAPLIVHCAAGVKPPVEAAARAYGEAYGVSVQLQYGGSGTLLANLRVAPRGDLFIAADESYLRSARAEGLVAEIIPLARMTPVIAVRAGNPKGIRSIEDLLRADVALANPDAAAIGAAVRDALRRTGQWEALERRARVFKPTVMDIANDVKLGTVDAGIVWDSTVKAYPELEAVAVEELRGVEEMVSIGVLASAASPAAALCFARWIGAPEKGLAEFARLGYRPVEGDAWAERPEAVLFSGGVNRIAIEETIAAFERREGAKVVRVYNGCGILVSQMKAGQLPDAYFACDVSFLRDVSALFLDAVNVSETDMVLLVAKGNPLGILALEDLARPGLGVGVANPEQSTLGDLTERLFRKLGLLERIAPNVRVQTPTADLLVNQIRTGSLDVVVVYRASTSQVLDSLTVVPISDPSAKAVQPYAVRRGSRNNLLMERLLEAIVASESRTRFESLGFRWRARGP